MRSIIAIENLASATSMMMTDTTMTTIRQRTTMTITRTIMVATTKSECGTLCLEYFVPVLLLTFYLFVDTTLVIKITL